MNLRVQLAVVCLSLLVLPWTVFLFVGELDRNLRDEQLKQSRVQAGAVADQVRDMLTDRGVRVRPASKTLLAGRLNNEILIDGYADDWSAFELGARKFDYPMNKIAVAAEDINRASSFVVNAAVRQRFLYLFIRVTDQQISYHNSSSNRIATGDQLIIRVPGTDGSIRRYTFRWEAPGIEIGRYLGEVKDGVRPIRIAADYRASLVESSGGYHIEVRIPVPEDRRFGLSLIDVDSTGNVQRWTGMFDPDEPDDIGQLQVIDENLTGVLAEYTEPGMRLRVFDGQGWLLADADRRLPDAEVRDFEPSDNSILDAVLHRFIVWSLAKNVETQKLPEIADGKMEFAEFELFPLLADDGRFLKDQYQRIFYTSVVNLTKDDNLLGYLLVQQPRVALTTFTETAMLRLVKIFGLAVSLIALVLIGFATLVSWRVKKLRDVVEHSVSGEGVVVRVVPQSTAPDEIGDLSRSFHTIMSRMDGYTNYLQSLGSRLSHELRTPLSVVATSLEGIDKTRVDTHTSDALTRAELGTARLQRLIRNLSEASSVEQTIQRSTKEVVDLRDWIRIAAEVYDSLYPDRSVVLKIDERVTQAKANVSLELLHQMLDKLMANAVDFSYNNSVIQLCLAKTASGVAIEIENAGSRLALPAAELFEPMVSIRNNRDDQPHMGFGLHIVKLIADYHGATCSAHDVHGKEAVRFSIDFPLYREAV